MKIRSLIKTQIRKFLNRLAGNEGRQYNGIVQRCRVPQFTYKKKILTLMGIDKLEQENFLKSCKKSEDYCDSGILINAAPKLLGEETLW